MSYHVTELLKIPDERYPEDVFVIVEGVVLNARQFVQVVHVDPVSRSSVPVDAKQWEQIRRVIDAYFGTASESPSISNQQ